MILTRKKVGMLIASFLVGLLFTTIYGYQTVYSKYKFHGKVKNYYKQEINVSYQSNNELQNSQSQRFINCYHKDIKEENFTDEMKNKLNEIYDYFNQANFKLSFAYEDLSTGLHISYNEDQTYFSASTIKAPVALYVYKQAEENKLNLDSDITYTPNFYVEGSGSLQYASFGSQYKLRDLVKRTIVESDNVAYQMIASVNNQDEIKKYWKEKGAKNFWSDSVWGSISPADGVIYMKELYKYSLKNNELSQELMKNFYNSVFPIIKSTNNSKVAHKSGWHYEIMHDTSIIFDENPYVLAVMTNKGYADYNEFFNQVSKLIGEFHELYWKNASEICKNH